MLPESKNPSRK
jgi:phosphoserine aminotransferase